MVTVFGPGEVVRPTWTVPGALHKWAGAPFTNPKEDEDSMASDYKPWYVSPSRLSVYTECPAQYEGRYVKKKEEKALQEPAPILDSGKLVHRALEIAAQSRIEKGDRDRKVTKKELLTNLEIATKELPKLDWQKPLQCTPEIVESAARVLGLCWKSMDFRNTILVEKTFSVPIGAIEDDNDRVVIPDAGLSGIIDRIDEVGDRIKIVDYKSGWSVMSRAEAEVDPQVNFYLVVGAFLYPGRAVDLELRYLNRGTRIGPIHYTPERREWLLNSYVKPILIRMATWKKYPETPGAPQCYSCFRKAECISFAKMIKGSLAPVGADMARTLALYERLTEIEGNVERLKKPIKEVLNLACEKQEDGEIFAGNHRCRMIFRNKTEYHDIRRTAAAAAKAILAAKPPAAPPVVELPTDPEELKKAYLALAERNSRLVSASIEAATAFEVACKIGKAQQGLVDDFVETLPEEVTLAVAQAIDGTSTNSGYYSLDVERLPIPFLDSKPSKAEIEDMATQEAERKLLPAGSMPLLDDSHEKLTVATTAVVAAAIAAQSVTVAAPESQVVKKEAVKKEVAPVAPTNGDLFQGSDKPVWAQADCKACGGSGLSSRGSPCGPCVSRTGKIGAGAS